MKKKKVVKEIELRDTTALQAKYEECVHILENLHNAITLALSITEEYDTKTPIEIVQIQLDLYKQFSNLSGKELEALQIESDKFIEQLKMINPELEIVDDRSAKVKTSTKKELLN